MSIDFTFDQNFILIDHQHLRFSPIKKDLNKSNDLIIIDSQDNLDEKEKIYLQPQRETNPTKIINFNPLKKAEKKKEKTKCGRKRKRENNNTNAKGNINSNTDNDTSHGKFSPDNLMRRLKANLMDSILNYLNNNLNDKSIMFQKLNKKINEDFKKNYNLTLMKRTIRDIFYNEQVSKVYKNMMDNNINRELIEKIEKKKVETKVIKILNMTFIEFINEIRDNHLDNFFSKIKEKEIKNKANNIELYMDKLKQLFANYEKWFNNKNARKSKYDK